LTLGFSKKLANLEHVVALAVAFHNFCRPHSVLYQKTTETTPARQRTPAMASWVDRSRLDGRRTVVGKLYSIATIP
jgi:hypothetical protein